MYRNNNKVFAPFQFKSSGAQELLSETDSGKDAPSVTRRRKWPLILIAGLIIALIVGAVAAALWSAPQRTPVEIRMPGVRMTEDGKVLGEGEIVIRGWLLDYRSEAKPSEIVTEEFQLLDTEFDTDELTFTDFEGRYLGSASNPNRQINYRLEIELSPDGSWCVIRQNDLYIVGSVAEDFDPMAILANSTFPDN